MAPPTPAIANSSTNEETVTRQHFEAELAQLRQMITGLATQNNMGARQANQFSTLAKVEFPKFYGEDVLGQLIKSKRENVTWTEYKEAITLRFGSVIDDPIAALKNVKVEVSEEHSISLYLGGLPTELEMAVRMFKLKTFSDAYCLTTLQEATLEVVKKMNRPFGNQTAGRFRANNVNGSNSRQSLLHLYSLIVLANTEEGEEEFLDVNESLVDPEQEEVQPQISLNALLGSTFPLAVSVAGGKDMVTVSMCKDFQWQLYGQTVTTDVMLIPLGGCDMTESRVEPSLQKVLTEYAEVFEVPNKLPPIRSHDHRIPLLPGTQPVNIRPYRHPPVQKDAIEAMIKELLESGVIKHNQSSFASLVVMVKNKGNSWRMCVDDRQLNKQTIKDKFPIPVIEELIDELGGVVIFSKLDLRSGYHQIRMYEDDIAKTSFKTHEGLYEFLVMPFGLTNAPSTFQALMIDVFREFLRKFTLVFFDDILVYIRSLEDHVQHLRVVLSKMRDHTLYVKESKCVFGTTQVEYLGHVISAQGVATDPFKNSFKWFDEAQESFLLLKEAMIQALVLGLPNFNQPFIVKTDASGIGLGAVLQQNDHPIAYLSKSLAPKHQLLSTYEKEFLAVLLALEKWRGYLLDKHFVIKTDHYSLKYLLDQRITTPAQMKWLPKLMGYDYEVVYKQGKDNAVADALSRREDVGVLFTLSTTSISTDLYQRIVASWTTDDHLKSIIADLARGKDMKHYVFTNNQLLRKGKLVVGNDEALRKDLLSSYHNGAIGGHSGVKATTHKICLLQPLPIPQTVWSSVSMDFIEGLPKSHGCTVILVVVDRLTKYTHFIPLSHPFTALQVAQVFLDQVCKLHGVPESIVSDRDKVFLSTFWKELFKLLHMKLLLSSAYHPQTDGQTEVVNRCLEGYLSYHSSIATTHFEALYGQPPPVHVLYVGGLSNVDVVDRSLTAREEAIELLKFHLQVTIRQGKQNKFSPKYFGPFEVIAKVGQVAYKLKLPPQSQIHDVFHVSQLEKVHGGHELQGPVVLPQLNKDGLLEVEPMKLMERKIVKKNNVVAVYGLVQWSNGGPQDAT
ncbi:transposon ty3-G gag-pol polyprotein [Tanacetum coccineum]